MTSTVVFPANFPLTLHERTQAPDVLRAKVTFEEYLELAEICPYNLDYINGEIVSMSKSSLPHESLVARFATILNILFDDDDERQIFSSNIVEVLSKSTMAYDLGDKLDDYQQIPSLQQVLFVNQQKTQVISFVRSEQPDVWLNTRFHALTDAVVVLDKPVLLSTIYRKVKFD